MAVSLTARLKSAGRQFFLLLLLRWPIGLLAFSSFKTSVSRYHRFPYMLALTHAHTHACTHTTIPPRPQPHIPSKICYKISLISYYFHHDIFSKHLIQSTGFTLLKSPLTPVTFIFSDCSRNPSPINTPQPPNRPYTRGAGFLGSWGRDRGRVGGCEVAANYTRNEQHQACQGHYRARRFQFQAFFFFFSFLRSSSSALATHCLKSSALGNARKRKQKRTKIIFKLKMLSSET